MKRALVLVALLCAAAEKHEHSYNSVSVEDQTKSCFLPREKGGGAGAKTGTGCTRDTCACGATRGSVTCETWSACQ